MESMRRSEANSSHHPKKVAVNSLPTEKNKHSSGSGSSLNNNKLSFNQQQKKEAQNPQLKQSQNQPQSLHKASSSSESSSSSSKTSSSSGASTSSESKDTNFEYDDNEWDVGGIGDLIIDLDADIEKSSSSAAAAVATLHTQSSNQPLSTNLSEASNNSGGGGGIVSLSKQILNAHAKSPSSASSSTSSSLPSSPTTISSSKSSSLSSLFLPLRTATTQEKSPHQHCNFSKQTSGSTSSASFQPTGPKSNSKLSSSKATSNLKLQQPALLAQLNSKSASSENSPFSCSSVNSSISRSYQTSGTSSHPHQIDKSAKLLNSAVTMSSQQSSGQGASKTTTKMSIDHQATLDKGLKMKIKRTKPGTKTSEAKHEIVKAEQNGTSAVEDIITSGNTSSSSSSSSGGKKHSQMNSSASQSISQTQQPNKRGSSGHRRDKMRDKIPHSRDKSDHGSGSSNNSNSGNSSSSSNANSTSQTERSSVSCNCTLDLQTNGVQTSCTNLSCGRSRTPSTASDSANSSSLSSRISSPSGANQQPSNSTANPISSSPSSEPGATTNPETNVFSNNGSSNAQTSNSGTPNAPGPPKDKTAVMNTSCNIVPSQQSLTTQVSKSTPVSLPNIQQTTQNSSGNNSSQSNSIGGNTQQQSISATVHHTVSLSTNCEDRSCSPPAKKPKCESKDMIDICIGTSVATITEPDCLGPCEPGTSVTLEGIVWHETEGGVLVVNVTWRGKTYVGTLLDCTRHDWAPPRFCDSPTEELDSRTPKGRGKRGRGATLTPDLSNFTETRSSVHSKLRNGAKGRGGRAITTIGAPTSTTTTNPTTTTSTATIMSSSYSSSTTISNTPSTSPIAFLPPRSEKRKSKDESPSPVNGESSVQQNSGQTHSLVNPVTGLNVQITAKKCKTASPCAVSPVLLECPEQDCSKKYKHANGLRYHQSHAHGFGSMDEDSLQLPESPRIAPPTTPSPAPATTPQSLSCTSNADVIQVPSPTASSSNSITSGPSQIVSLASENPTLNTSGGLLTTLPQTAAPIVPPNTNSSAAPISNQVPQHALPGGSITSGISGHALSHQQHSILVGTIANSGMIGGNNQSIPETPQSLLPQKQQVSVANSNIGSVPVRADTQIKPSVLRYGSPSDNMSTNQNLLSSQGSIRDAPTATSITQNSGAPSNSEGVGHQPPYNQSPASIQGLAANKPQGYGKQKKNRSKSPLLGEYDNSTSLDNVQSPAYSDISDDSTPVLDTEMSDKLQSVKHSDAKKIPEVAPPQIASLSSYGMYPFYSQQQYMVPPDHQAPKATGSHSSIPPSIPTDYNKSKDPPLDLITKPIHSCEPPSKDANISQNPASQGPQNTNKSIPHFYPYNYMTPGYPYNMEQSYGPISMVSEDNKLSSISNASLSLKEERNKESPSPNEHGKMPAQMMSTKLLKNEPSVKEIKSEPGAHVMHPKEPPVQSMAAYPGMYQRHSVGVSPQPSQHLSREEEVRRFYMYSDQRRPNIANNPAPIAPPVSIKDESQSPSQSSISASISQGHQISQMSQSIQGQSSQNSSQPQKSVKSSVSTSQTSSSQKATNLVKDTKDDKDVKIKQEGQKPTMETQGPPPPPTSQYFLHPQYLTPNFSFDPGHPMYRNVLMSTSPYNTPPYLPMPRFHAPEDLSRNPGPKALDVLQQAANMQYYGPHKIHELSERALKSPNSNSKASVSSPQQNVSNVVGGSNLGGGPGILQQTGGPGGPLNLQPPAGAMPPVLGAGTGVGISNQKSDGKTGTDSSNKSAIGGGANDSRSPPPQRHVHTHHHTHVGLGYPMYTAPYGAAVLASQQAAVAVINPFPPGPTK